MVIIHRSFQTKQRTQKVKFKILFDHDTLQTKIALQYFKQARPANLAGYVTDEKAYYVNAMVSIFEIIIN